MLSHGEGFLEILHTRVNQPGRCPAHADPAPRFSPFPRVMLAWAVEAVPGRIEVRRCVSGLAALILTAVALPALLARVTGGHPPSPGPQLAALAPVATLPACAAVVVAATAAWWLAVVLAIPAALLLAWQLPPAPHNAPTARPRPRTEPGTAPDMGAGAFTVRVLTLNVLVGRADPAEIVRNLRQHSVDVLFVQELTPELAHRLTETGMADVLPFSHLEPRAGSSGTGLWARWPLIPLPHLPDLWAATPRARVDPLGGRPLTLTAVHPISPMRGHARQWQHELAAIRTALADAAEPQVVAGDFNATRDHQPFRDLLAARFLDCADAARRRRWPGFTWPTRGKLPVMRLDHVLVSRAGTAVREVQLIKMPGTDHHGVLAVIELTQAS
jgi:endonuclease/exonuclease/phosphatase (EEP) superfamily protein YafD